MDFSSKLLEAAVNEMAQLPGIGKRTALRLVLHLLKQPKEQTIFLSNALTNFRDNINFCESCHTISDIAICEICSNDKRNHQLICVVEDVRDVMAIENTGQYVKYKKIVSKLTFSISGQNCNKKNLELINSKVKNLVDSGLNINKLFDDNTLTPLMYAINIKACTEFITFLIKELKADKNLKNSNNLTALDLVKNMLSPAKSKSRPNPKLRARLNLIKNILEKKIKEIKKGKQKN